MLCIDNLIRLYYCYHGSFDSITKSSFGSEVLKQFDESSFSDIENYLYSVLGYKSNELIDPKSIADFREEFCKKSYMTDYMKSLISKYKVRNNSELVDKLDSKGLLGIQKRPVYTLGNAKGVVPSKFLNRYVCDVLYLVESYLDNYLLGGSFDCCRLKLAVAINPDVDAVLKEYGLSYGDFFRIEFVEGKKIEIKDDVIYMNDIGYDKDEIVRYLVRLYLYGMPTIPLYLRDKFISMLPRCKMFGTIDEVLLDLIDLSYVADCSPRNLVRTFGLDFPNPEDMWRTYNGFFFFSGNDVYFTNKTSNSFIKFTIEEFLTLVNRGEICNLNVEELFYLRDLDSLKGSNIF